LASIAALRTAGGEILNFRATRWLSHNGHESRKKHEEAPALERLLIAYARRFPLRKGKLRVIDGLWRAAAGNRGTARIANLRYGGLKMPCELTEVLQRQFYFFGTYFVEEQILNSWINAAKASRIIFDVGANFGIYSLAAVASQPRAIVHAFEPTPEIANRLQETARLNSLDNLIVHQVAVSNHSGDAVLRRYRGERGANAGMNYICVGAGDPEEERVPKICLDEFCRQRNISGIDLLKVDVQGHEQSVLHGVRDLLNRGRLGIVYLELNWSRGPRSSCPATESVELLAKVGYRFANPADCHIWREAGSWLHGLTDVIARNPNARGWIGS
jgi:FkbM family methyltransferase